MSVSTALHRWGMLAVLCGILVAGFGPRALAGDDPVRKSSCHSIAA